MAEMTNYMEDAVIQFFLRNDADTYTPPTTIYLALFTAAPGEAGGGTESTGGSYARQSVTFTDPAGTGDTSNSNAITFSAMPASTVTHAALMDASSGGNMLMYTALSASQVFGGGTDFDLAVGDVTVNFD